MRDRVSAADKLAEALHLLLDYCENSDDAMYGTLATSLVRGICNEAIAAYEQEKAAERTRGMEIRDLLDPNTHEGPTPFGGRRTDRSRT